MGFLGGFAKVILGFLLSTLLLASVMAFSLSQLTAENNAKDFFVSLFSKIVPISEQDASQTKDAILEQCNTQKVETINMVVNPQTNDNITISCAEIRAGKSFVQIMSEQLFDQIYNKKYDCEFIQCLQKSSTEGPFVIFSSVAHSFFSGIYIYPVIGVIIVAALLMLFKPWYSSLKNIGKSFVFVGLPSVLIYVARTFLISKMATGQLSSLLPSISKVTDLFIINFVVILAIGLVFFITGKIIEKKAEKKPLEKAKPKKKAKK